MPAAMAAYRRRPGRDTMIAAMNEARKVGACQGVLVTQKDLREYVAVLDSLNPEAHALHAAGRPGPPSQ